MTRKSILITGSSKGLGEALAYEFASHDYDIILHGRNKKDLSRVTENILQKKVKCSVVRGDLREIITIEELSKKAKEEGIKILINNAGSNLSALKKPLYSLTDEEIDELINVHLTSPIKLTKRVINYFLEKGEGTVININSLSGLETQEGRAVYCSSKWGLRGFTKTLRLECERNNIKIMEFYPSRIKTIPEFKLYGWEPEKIAEEIYSKFINNEGDEFIMDRRPERYKKK